MGALLQNETIKLFKRKSSWIMIVGLVVAMVGMGMMMMRQNVNRQKYLASNPNEHNYEFNGGIMAYRDPAGEILSSEEYWQKEELDAETYEQISLTVPETITLLEKELAKYERLPKPEEYERYQIRSLRKQIEYYEAYQARNQMPSDDRKGQTSAQFFSRFGELYVFPTIIAVIIASTMIAAEFAGGTIKLLLTRPHSRTQILFSKYIVTLGYSFFISLVMAGSAFLASFMLPKQSLFLPLSIETGGQTAFQVASGLFASNYLLMIFYITVAFFFSGVVRSQALAVGIGLSLLFSGSILSQLLPMFIEKYDWLKWIIFNLLSLNSRVVDAAYYVGGNLSVSAMAVGIIAHIIVVLAATVVIFNKRDVALS